MRLLQLWARLFVASICVYAVALIAVDAVATPWILAASMWAVASLGVAGAFVAVAIVVRVATLKRRLSRAVAARHDSVIVTPYDVAEQAFAPLAESGAIRNLTAAVILPGQQVIYFPTPDSRGPQQNLYEIGSLTKPMTAEVLATMIVDRTATMATRIGDVLPHLPLPTPIAEITLEELVTHQSGLPRIPRTLKMTLAAFFSSDPYRWFGDSDLVRSLARARRTTSRGTYSNFGFAALGRLLAELNGSDYRSAMAARLLRPLGLSDTYVDPDEETASRHVHGHDLIGIPTPRWHAGAIVGAGGISMTIADGAAWLAAHVDPPAVFRDIVAMVTRPLAPLGADRIGMGWIVKEIDGRAVVWHNGGTGGFSSFAAFDTASGVGVIAFAASFHTGVFDRAGFQVVRECAARWGRSDDTVARAR